MSDEAKELARLRARVAELARFRAIAEVSPDFICFATPVGTTIYLNPGGRAMCGIAADESLDGSRIDRYHAPDTLPALFEVALPTVIETGVWHGESALLGPEGERIPVSQLILAHHDPEGEVAYVSTVMRDLRPLRLLEAQLQQSQRLESIGRLAGGVAHDFNNMLLIIDNYVRFVLETLDEDDERHADLRTALDASDRSARLCRQLLGFARQQVITPQLVNLEAIVLDFGRLIGRLLGNDVEFVVETAAELWPVRVDPTQFEQVLANLAVNARDAMPRGGRLTVELRNLSFDGAQAQRHPELAAGDYVMLAVTDTGMGIAKEDQARVFEPFFSTKAVATGTGLGLATVHGAVKQNGGHIWLHSELGKGTCFEILLPRAELHADEVSEVGELREASETRNEAVDPACGRGETVLVVEDELMIRRMAVRVLLGAGYEVLEAKEPREALALLSVYDGPLHLCVSDVVMPQLSGKQFAVELAKRYPDTPVLFVSGYTQDTIVHRGVLEPGVAFLAKPFTGAELLARIRERLDGE